MTAPAPIPLFPDQATAQDIVDRNIDFVWRCLRRLGVPTDACDDATQEVLIVVLQKADKIEPEKERAFVYGVLRNIAKRVKRCRSVPLDHTHLHAPPHQEIHLDTRNKLALLDRILTRMSRPLAEVIILSRIEQMTNKDIAEALNLPLGTVASRIRLAKQSFSRLLKQEGAAL